MNRNNKKNKVKDTQPKQRAQWGGFNKHKKMMKQKSINKNIKEMSTRNSKKNTKHEKKQKQKGFLWMKIVAHSQWKPP